MAPIKTCVLGVGLSGLTFHVPFLLALPELFILHSVLERNPRTPGGRVRERFGVTIKIHRTFEDVIRAFGGGGARRGRGRASPFQEEILMGENIEVQNNISFLDAAKGGTKDINITPLVQCKTCDGNGLKKGQSRST